MSELVRRFTWGGVCPEKLLLAVRREPPLRASSARVATTAEDPCLGECVASAAKTRDASRKAISALARVFFMCISPVNALSWYLTSAAMNPVHA